MTEYSYVKNVFGANGGFSMEQHFGEIPYVGTFGTDLTQLFDLTETLQLGFDVRIFNEKLGIYKDISNQHIIDTSSNKISNMSSDDYITLTADELINNINESQIVSLGKYTSLYSDFKRNTNNYFGYADGFPSIYDTSGTSVLDSGVFTKSDLISILSERYYDSSGNYRYKLNGQIQLNELSNILTFMCNTNPFNNRTTETIEDGFIADDRILVASGITIALDLTIYNADYIEAPLYNNSSLLQYTINAPLLLILQNLS